MGSGIVQEQYRGLPVPKILDVELPEELASDGGPTLGGSAVPKDWGPASTVGPAEHTDAAQTPCSRSSAPPGATGGVTDGVAFAPESRIDRLSGRKALILRDCLGFGSGGRDRTYDQLINRRFFRPLQGPDLVTNFTGTTA